MTSSAFHRRLSAHLEQLEQRGQRRFAKTIDSQPDGKCRIAGRELVNFGGNDYLNLAHQVSQEPSVQQVFAQQAGATASALVAGRSRWHDQLESALADFERTEAALLFPTGYAANLGVLSSLVESRDAVFCDRDNHASIIDAARSCRGRFCVYRRDRMDALEESIIRRRDDVDQIFIVTDGVFSMDGTIPNLSELCQIAERNKCLVIVDEAHGTGVLGSQGRGACDLCDVEDRVLLRIGTLSKALGGLGGFVAGDKATIEWLRNTARTQFFSTALPPAICAAMLESIRIVQSEPQRRQRLSELTAFAHSRMKELSLNTVGAGVAPIIPVVIGDDRQAVTASEHLEGAGWFVPAIRPPTVPTGTARLRLSLNASHTPEQIDAVLLHLVQWLAK